MKFFNITNHQLTAAQKEDLFNNWGITEIVELPDELKQIWGNVSPKYLPIDILVKVIAPLRAFIFSQAEKGVVMVMGEFSSVYRLIQELKRDFVIVVATSKRETIEEIKEDGTVVKTAVFSHVQFREVI